MRRKGIEMAALRNFFDYQRFAGNARLSEMIRNTESSYSEKISFFDLELVSAAGVLEIDQNKKDDDR